MATLIAVYYSSGCVGRCDAKCYNATGPDCQCICGGRNHGKGKRQAIENTREMADEWIEAYAQQKGLTEFEASIPARRPDRVQLELPL
jgi:hypothetical protein